MPNLITRTQAALYTFKHGLSPWNNKAAPFMWPAHRQGKPEWQLVDTQAYISEGFNLNTLIYSAIMYKVRSQTIAPLRAYTGEMDSPTLLPLGRPLSDLVMRPNPMQSWAEFHGQNVVYLNLSGNCYIVLKRSKKDSPPEEMYSLRPDRVYIVPGTNSIKGYLYVPEGKGAADGLSILPQDMMHVKLPNPDDPLEGMGYGLSPISPLARSADVDNKVTEFLKLFFDRGTVLSGLLKFEDPLQSETIATIRERWQEIYGGYGNWAEIGILDHGGDYQRLSMTFEEMGFEGLDERNESRVLGPFGVPPILIGSRIGLLHATYSNYELARKAFWEDTMVPETKLFESEFQYYLQDSNAFVAFDTSKVPALQKDIPLQVEAWAKLVDHGIPKTLAAATVGLAIEDIPDGDTAYAVPGLTPIGETPKQPEGEKPEAEEEAKSTNPFGLKGGSGSGHRGHRGIPGQRGGSAPSGGMSISEARKKMPWFDTYVTMGQERGWSQSALPDGSKVYTEFEPGIPRGEIGRCYANALEQCEKNPELDLAVGIQISEEGIKNLQNFNPSEHWEPYLDTTIHAWNLTPSGKVVDSTFGTRWAKTGVYIGVKLNAGKFASDSALHDRVGDLVVQAIRKFHAGIPGGLNQRWADWSAQRGKSAKGGPGSGHHGHRGIPGVRGGSASSSYGVSRAYARGRAEKITNVSGWDTMTGTFDGEPTEADIDWVAGQLMDHPKKAVDSLEKVTICRDDTAYAVISLQHGLSMQSALGGSDAFYVANEGHKHIVFRIKNNATFDHEMGHHVIMSSKEGNVFRHLWEVNTTFDRLTWYSSVSADEGFAESYMAFRHFKRTGAFTGFSRGDLLGDMARVRAGEAFEVIQEVVDGL